MNWIKTLRTRLFALFRPRRLDADMDEELRTHVEMRTQHNLDAGMKPPEARYAALRQFGGAESIKEECREQRDGFLTRHLSLVAQDLRYGARILWKNPGFSAVAVLTLALGIGANTAIFSAIQAVLLKPLPYREPDRIMMVWADNPSFNLGIHELPPSQLDVLDWRREAHSFEQIAAVGSVTVDLTGAGDPRRVGGVEVTANFFSTLGVQPMLGRTFTTDEDQPGNNKVVVISHALWQSEFGGDAKLIGTSITLNNERRLVVGVMPPGFSFPHSAEMPSPYNLPAQTELWVPVARDLKFWQDDINRQFIVLGRLKPAVTVAQAQSEMDTIAGRVARERTATHTGWSTHLRPLAIQVAGQTRPALFLLLGAVAFVLLIACANVANLLLCRSATRRKEMAIRAAIGAGRGRVIRQLLTESLLLALLGGGVGLLLGDGGLRVLLAVSPPNIPRLHEATFDGWVFGFSLLVSLLTGVIFGLVPAWQAAKVNLSETMNASSRSNSSGGHSRSYGSLVTAEVAIAVVLLVGAALMLQSFRRLTTQDAGFAKTGVCAFDIAFRGARYEKGPSRTAFFQQARERLGALAGVREVAATSHLPLSGSENVTYFFVEGAAEPAPGQEPVAERRVVTPGYLGAMRVSILKGRDFDTSDETGKPSMIVVSETLARKFYPDGNALGKRLRLKDSAPGEWLTIVGVSRDVRGSALETQPRPAIYRPLAQDPGNYDEMTVVVRGVEGERSATLENTLRREMKTLDPTLPVANFRTIEHLVSNALAKPRFSSFLMGLFALMALALTMVGLYGVVAYTVSQRTRELGIRMALGATRWNVLRLVIVQGMRPALAGLLVGVAGAIGLSRVLATQLFEIKPTDPVTFAAVSFVLAGVALLACWLPARRAARLDPMVALRTE